MKTSVDDAIARFMAVVLETDDISERVQERLDCVRERYGFNVVYILKKIRWNNIFTFASTDRSL